MSVLAIIVFYTVNNPGWKAHDVPDHIVLKNFYFGKLLAKTGYKLSSNIF